MAKTFNWGIIGPGKIAHSFAQDVALIEGAKIHAVASRAIERAQVFAEQYGVAHAYGRYEEIVHCPDLDAIYIATPHPQHFENALLCLQHKVPVLCEKPLAINAKQVRTMLQAAKEQDTFFMEALWTRFLPLTKSLIQAVQDQEIGALKMVRADFGFPAPFDENGRLFNPDLGGGALLDVGIYPVFFALLFMGIPDEISAISNFGYSHVDESVSMLFKYKDGRMASLDCSLVAKTPIEAHIYGEKGAIKVHTRFHEPHRATIDVYGQAIKEVHLPPTGRGYYHEAVEVMECVQAGRKESDLMTHDFSLQLMETLDRIRKEIGLVYPKYDN